jgi:hypothetical protein
MYSPYEDGGVSKKTPSENYFEIPRKIQYLTSYQPVSGMMKHKSHALPF